MTQPPLSQSILDLEKKLGFRLFDRNKRNVSLTPVAALWLPYVKSVLHDVEHLPNVALRLEKGEIGTVCLSFVGSAIYSVLPGLVASYKNKFPQVEVTLRESTTDLQIRGLLSRDIDVGIIIPSHDSVLPSELNSKIIKSEPLVIAAPADMLQGQLHLDCEDLIELSSVISLPLILFPRDFSPGLYDLIIRYFELRGLKPVFGQQAVQMQTMISLVSQNMGYALVPSSMKNLTRRGVFYFSIKGACPTIETAIAWNAHGESPAVTALVGLALTL